MKLRRDESLRGALLVEKGWESTHVCLPNLFLYRREMALQAASSTPNLNVLIFGRKCVQSCVFWMLDLNIAVALMARS